MYMQDKQNIFLGDVLFNTFLFFLLCHSSFGNQVVVVSQHFEQ